MKSNSMKRLQSLTKEISEITLKIEQEYPELYRFLDENPVTISSFEHSELTINNFIDYLNTLKQLLNHYIEAHKMKKSTE